MKIEGEYTFAAPRDIVWTMLQDPVVLAAVMPGCEALEEIEENVYEGTLKIKVGPVQGKFDGTVTLSNLSAPEGYDIKVNGKGAPGFVRGTGSLRLVEETGLTQLYYEGDAQVGGRLASVGQRLLDTSTKAIIRQSLEGLGQQIQQRQMANIAIEAGLEPSEPELPVAPSQTEFALGVARNFIDELLPESAEERAAFLQKVVGGTAVFITLLLIFNWLAKRIARIVTRELAAAKDD